MARWNTTAPKKIKTTTKTMVAAMFPKTARNPWASPPETTPPEVRASPPFHRAGTTPAEAAVNSSLQKSMCPTQPHSRGSSSAQVVRSVTGRPRWRSRITPATAKEGAAKW